MNLRVRASALSSVRVSQSSRAAPVRPGPRGSASVFRAGVSRHAHLSAWQSGAGRCDFGPAIVEEFGSTTVVFPEQRLVVDDYGIMVIRSDKTSKRGRA